MEDIYRQLYEHYGTKFKWDLTYESFCTWHQKATTFKCEFMEECEIENNTPTWSIALGDIDSPIMIIGEAPSKSEGIGAYTGGSFDQWEDNKKSRLVILRNLVNRKFGVIPYFTDVVKCGNTNDELFKKRRGKCINHLLKGEIEKIKPQKIICVGAKAESALSELSALEDIRNIIKPEEIKTILHYSNNANFKNTIEDKDKIIWQYQLGTDQEKEVIRKLPLGSLSFFKK